ncbi:FtsX-like permease family protein [Candidatus Sumerlaeota bacterium]|nr:FtsX-like permease family protein [Candidatus Sumerlaeota bacterium]
MATQRQNHTSLVDRSGQVRRQRQLTGKQVLLMAWKNITVRMGRSMLVTSGIVLALAFLTYIMSSDAILRSVLENAPPSVKETLSESGKFAVLEDADAQIQTRWMVGLALLVSFVGILNAMLLSVTERYAEIGTMKCLGALDSLIVRLFLLESFFQGIAGTTVGILIGLLLAFTESLFGFGWTVAEGVPLMGLVPWNGIFSIIGIAMLAGVALTVAGALYPGWRAAKMKPVEAMRAQV